MKTLNFILLQYNYTSLPSILVFGLIGLALFVALRMLMLWYWRIDTIVQNQIETNNLLRSIYNEQIKENDKSKTI